MPFTNTSKGNIFKGFESTLLLLFRCCTICKADNPLVQARENGTEVIIKTTCIDQKCQKEQTWYSQPFLPNSKIPAGNFLLCMSTLLSGGSATKLFQVFRHMGLGCVSINTFFKYQRASLVSFVFYDNTPILLILLILSLIYIFHLILLL